VIAPRSEDSGLARAAANLSDLAADGCQEGDRTHVGLVSPAHSVELVGGGVPGPGPGLERYGGDPVGGDCQAAPAAPAGDHRPWTALGPPGRSAPADGTGPGEPGLISTGHRPEWLGLAGALAGAAARLPARQLAEAGTWRPPPPPTPASTPWTPLVFDARPPLSPGGLAGADSSGMALRRCRRRLLGKQRCDAPARRVPADGRRWMVLPAKPGCLVAR